ncbi:MAG: 2-C-methyl-D-erythritol 4-phosphate cytidylyltransferase, partial [Thermoguttaceae bacterium]
PVSDSLKRVVPNQNSGRGKRGKPRELSLDSLIPDDPEPQAVGDGVITESVDRSNIWRAQTPQVFRRDWFEEVYARRPRGKSALTTDDSMLFEQAGHAVYVLEASALNIKITTRSDLQLAEAILKILPGPKKNVFHPFADEDLFR